MARDTELNKVVILELFVSNISLLIKQYCKKFAPKLGELLYHFLPWRHSL
jgi:hypothetical protein